MANYYGTTASSGAEIKKGKTEALRAYLALWGFQGEGNLVCDIREDDKGDTLHIYGDDDFAPCPLVTKEEAEKDENLEEGEPNWDACDGGAFLSGLTPFLKPFNFGHGNGKGKALIIVQTVGNEKCRFPLGALEYILRPNGKVDYNGFKGF